MSGRDLKSEKVVWGFRQRSSDLRNARKVDIEKERKAEKGRSANFQKK